MYECLGSKIETSNGICSAISAPKRSGVPDDEAERETRRAGLGAKPEALNDE